MVVRKQNKDAKDDQSWFLDLVIYTLQGLVS